MWPFTRQSEYEVILKRHIDDDFSLFACGKDAPAESVLQAFEGEIGFALPADFRAFSKSPLGGVYIEVKEAIWPRAREHAIGPFWSFLYGLYVHGFARGIPEFMDIRRTTEQFRQETGTKLVPFLTVISDADVYGFDEQGAIRRWNHEIGEAEPVNKNFREVFAHEVEQLRKRKDRKKAEGGAA